PALQTSTVPAPSPCLVIPEECVGGAFTTRQEPISGCNNDTTPIRTRVHADRDHDRDRHHEHWHRHADCHLWRSYRCDAIRPGKYDCPAKGAGGDGEHLHRP